MGKYLGDIEFSSLKSEMCVYIYKDEVGFVILTFYGDDLLLLGANRMPTSKLKK